ncbi:MAG: hypothetical protein R3B91_13815 [Planctomycetaceae bacterium]
MKFAFWCLIVAVHVAAVVNDRVYDPDIPRRRLVIHAKDPHTVAREVLHVHVLHANPLAASLQMNPPDIHARLPQVVSPDNLTTKKRHVADVLSHKRLPIGVDLFHPHKPRSLQIER